MWYYSHNKTDRQGPVSQEQLHTLIQRGELQSDHLVWREGMTEWTKVSEHPEWQNVGIGKGPPPVGGTTPPVPGSSSSALPPNLTGWLKFVGVMTIILGALYCITCVGLLWGVLMIVGGVALLSARSALDLCRNIPPDFVPFLEKLNTFFMVLGVVYIIMLLGITVMVILYGGMLFAVLSSI